MNNWQKVSEILKQGGVVIIPTDSSYGMAALANKSEAIERLYKIKGREANRPSLLIVGSMEQARELVEFTPLAHDLARKYWLASPKPFGEGGGGGLTLILNAKNLNLAKQIYGNGKTLAIRLPSKKELVDLALSLGPFILPSANFAGETPPLDAHAVDKKLLESVDFFLDEPTDGNTTSTLVDARGEKPVILRQGAVKVEEKS